MSYCEQCAKLERQLTAANADAESWRQQMMDREKNIFDLDKQFTDAKADAESWHHQADERDKTIYELEGWLKKAQAEIARLTDQLTMAIGVGNGNAAQCDKLTAQCEDYRKALETILNVACGERQCKSCARLVLAKYAKETPK